MVAPDEQSRPTIATPPQSHTYRTAGIDYLARADEKAGVGQTAYAQVLALIGIGHMLAALVEEIRDRFPER